jgi:hypothetical protein
MIAAAIVAIAGVLLSLTVGGSPSPDMVSMTQEEVRRNGADVMDFDLDRTLHRFLSTTDGGDQVVEVRDPLDFEQILLVRAHLQEIAMSFQKGDFVDPAAVHGPDMAGLAVLRANPDRFTVTYTETLLGAKIAYRSEDADVVTAMHAWFDAQLADHGTDATAEDGSDPVQASAYCLHHLDSCTTGNGELPAPNALN